MNPFFFGESKRQLFGIHAPARGVDRGAVLLCYPFGAEYMRAHRAFRQLTNLLTRTGLHVLRFDYSGTGDSAGDAETSSMEAWLEDIRAGIDELKEATGAERVSVAGLRWGGTMASLAIKDREDIDRIVLWDPIVIGSEYARDLRETGTPFSQAGNDTGVLGVGGFPVHRDVLSSMAAVNLLESAQGLPAADLVISEEQPDYSRLRETLEGLHPSARYLLRPSPNHWMEGDAFGSALIPTAIIEGVVHCLSQEVTR